VESANYTGIGLVAIGPREISSGDQFDHLFPQAQFADKRVVPNGSIDQIVREMGKVIRKHRSDTKAIAPMLKGDNLEHTCRNIWEFVYNHIQYRKDKPGEEQLRTPARLWADREAGGDCDCGTIFISTILLNLGIEPVIRIAGYDGRDFQHVYPIVPIPGKNQYYVIDFVVGEFNYEKEFTKHRDYTMSELGIPIHVLSGLDDIPANNVRSDEREVYEYLLQYRQYMIANPVVNSLSTKNPVAFLKMLDYAIENFWKGEAIRNQALDQLDREEKRLNFPTTALSGLGEGELSGFFSTVKNAANKATGAIKDVATAVNKVNPVAVGAKAAFRQLVLMNYQGLATRLAFGRVSLFDTKNYPKDRLRPVLRELYSDAEIDEYFKYVDRVNNALEIYRNTFGGTGNEWDMLKSTIKKAALHNAVGFPERVDEARKLSKEVERVIALYKKHFKREFLGDLYEADGYLGEAATATGATVATASPILTAIGTALGGGIATALVSAASGGKVNEKDIKNAQDLYARWKSGELTDADYQKAINEATNKALNDAGKAANKAAKSIISPNTPVTPQATDNNPGEKPSFWDAIKKLITANPWPAAITLGAGAYFALPYLQKRHKKA
jgi:hypothetical protein